ncbi:unnamed protein product [Zymoseptoria tritici ST99CH_1A5]|uniref:F-box domain-containing protein n=2 Tax=Zymoseptoria tritici TaxID=1047171 RepID=A0A2H1H5L1_ZYMTR|nr:unnamed protein product [Zymoseptoria tritici ST99CH_1E4]SMY29569.1 unnamed protein product [Zymoseptoria tritici ST99CH_1A5]
MPPHLPNEIWLHILSHIPQSYTSSRDLWISLRLVSSQLHACVDQHFATRLLPLFVLELEVTIPSYDQRNPLRGRAVFHFLHLESKTTSDGGGEGGGGGGNDRAVFELLRTKPDFYRTQFLSRWQGLRKRGGQLGELKDVVRWEIEFGEHRTGRVKLWEGRVDSVVQGKEGDGEERVGLRVGCGWREIVGSFFRE